MMLGKLPVPGRSTIWIIVGQGPTLLAVGAGGGCLDIFTLIYPFFSLSPSFVIKGGFSNEHGKMNVNLRENEIIRKRGVSNVS